MVIRLQKKIDDEAAKHLLELLKGRDIHSITAEDIGMIFEEIFKFKYKESWLNHLIDYSNFKQRKGQFGDQAYEADGTKIIQPTSAVDSNSSMDFFGDRNRHQKLQSQITYNIKPHLEKYREINAKKKGNGQKKQRFCSCVFIYGLFNYCICKELSLMWLKFDGKANLAYVTQNIEEHLATLFPKQPHVTDAELNEIAEYFVKDSSGQIRKDFATDWEQVLADLIPEWENRLYNLETEQILVLCPLHDDTDRSLSINLDRLSWNCKGACKSMGSIHTLISEISGKFWHQLKDGYRLNGDQELPPPLQVKPVGANPNQKMELPTELTKNHWIITKRHFDLDHLIGWGCKETNDGLYIPVIEEGVEIGYTVRANEGMDYKYRNAKGFHKSKHLFGVDKVQDVEHTLLFVVEGQLDVIALHEWDYSAVGLFGSDMSDTQLDQIIGLGALEICLALDDDDAGKQGVAKALDKLRETDLYVSVLDWRPYENTEPIPNVFGTRLYNTDFAGIKTIDYGNTNFQKHQKIAHEYIIKRKHVLN